MNVEKKNRDFGWALSVLKSGGKVTRAGWNWKGMFLVLVGSGTVNHPLIESGAEVESLPYIGMWTVNSSGRRVFLNGWSASLTDMLSEDWEEAA